MPTSATVAMLSVALSWLVIVKVWAVLVVPTRWLPKSFDEGVTPTVCTTPLSCTPVATVASSSLESGSPMN